MFKKYSDGKIEFISNNLFIQLDSKQVFYDIEPDFLEVLIKSPYCLLSHSHTIVSDDIVRLIHMFLFFIQSTKLGRLFSQLPSSTLQCRCFSLPLWPTCLLPSRKSEKGAAAASFSCSRYFAPYVALCLLFSSQVFPKCFWLHFSWHLSAFTIESRKKVSSVRIEERCKQTPVKRNVFQYLEKLLCQSKEN